MAGAHVPRRIYGRSRPGERGACVVRRAPRQRSQRLIVVGAAPGAGICRPDGNRTVRERNWPARVGLTGRVPPVSVQKICRNGRDRYANPFRDKLARKVHTQKSARCLTFAERDTMMLRLQSSSLNNAPTTVNRDEVLQALARRALDNSGYRVLSRLECTLVNGAVVLSGVVSCFYHKQLAQAAVRKALCSLEIAGRLEDRIDVREP